MSIVYGQTDIKKSSQNIGKFLLFQNIGKFLLFIMVKLESENVSLELFALQIQAHFHDCKLTVK